MTERLTNKETIALLDKGLQIPPELAERVYRKLFEIENSYDETLAITEKKVMKLISGEVTPIEKPKRTYTRKANTNDK